MNTEMIKNVTVVVPVYKDLESIKDCIASLKVNLDERHKVILINDMSPDWKELEKSVLEDIEGHGNFKYYRNSDNLGFTGSCNRAVFELDDTDNDILLLNSDTVVTEGFLEEMQEVLYMTEKHGVVCPRSNCATIYTIPFRKRASLAVTPDNSYETYLKMRNILPRYQVMPTGVGFAMLIKRNLICEYGLFDEIYSPGYHEENDFCMRINKYGYSTVAANRAFVYHLGAKSFEGTRSDLDLAHSAILEKRYPEYPEMVSAYISRYIDPADSFADVLGEIYKKKRVLIDLYEIPSAHNGTAKYGFGFLKSFYELYHEKYDIAVLMNEEAAHFHGMDSKELYSEIYFKDNIEGSFDIAFVPSQIILPEHLEIILRCTLKYVFCMQDIISLRSWSLLMDDPARRSIFEESVRFADAIVFPSAYSMEDTERWYGSIPINNKPLMKVVYHGRSMENRNHVSDKEIPFESYTLIVGNSLPHKHIEKTLERLKKGNRNYIVLGSKLNGKLSDNVYGYKSGMLEDDFINLLYQKCDVMLFPSVYEGFGLPILSAIDFGKKIIVRKTKLNLELSEVFDPSGDFMLFYDDDEEIGKKIESALAHGIKKSPDEICSRTWNDVAEEVEEILAKLIEKDINTERLYEKWSVANVLSDAFHVSPYCNKGFSKLKRKVKGVIKKNRQIYKYVKRVQNYINRK